MPDSKLARRPRCPRGYRIVMRADYYWHLYRVNKHGRYHVGTFHKRADALAHALLHKAAYRTPDDKE